MDKFIPRDKHIFTQKMLEQVDIEVIYTSMVASNESIFVFGGDTKGVFTASAEVRRYDLSDQKWHKMKEMPHYIWGATAQIVDDKVFIMGGGRASTYTSNNSVYNIKSNTWEEKAGLPVSRKGLLSGVIDGIIYITGGYRMWGIYTPLLNCHGYNPKTDTWKECHMPIYSRTFGMSVVVGNFLYALGGYADTANSGSFINKGDYRTMDKYSPKTDKWEAMPSMPRSRKDSVAVAIDSKIFILCGRSEDEYTTMDYYDTRTKEWTISDIPTPQLRNPGVAMIGNKIYLTGGINNVGEYNKNLYEITYGGMRE